MIASISSTGIILKSSLRAMMETSFGKLILPFTTREVLYLAEFSDHHNGGITNNQDVRVFGPIYERNRAEWEEFFKARTKFQISGGTREARSAAVTAE